MDILAGYTSSIFQHFASYLGAEFDLVEEDIGLVLDEYNSNVITYELPPGINIFTNLSEFHLGHLQNENGGVNNTVVFEIIDISKKTELVVTPSIIAIKFEEKSFFITILGFNPHWDYKQCNEYVSKKNVKLSTIDEVHRKCDAIDGSVVNAFRQPITFSFVLENPPRIL